MQSRLKAYRDITQDYINYLAQHGYAEPKEEEKTENIPVAVPLSLWRNFFTGVFYSGQYGRFFLWDILAGGIKNSFFLNIAPKSSYANFIAVVDRIVKLDKQPNRVLDELKKAAQKGETKLLECLFAYFLSLQENTADKDDAYYSAMKALKRDINDLARAACLGDSTGKRIIKKEKLYQVCELFLNKDEDWQREQQKNQNRQTKTRWKRVAKIMACGMGIAEICIALAGFTALVGAAPASGALLVLFYTFKALVGVTGLFFGYTFAKNELFTLGKQISLKRFFKKKNPNTGEYEPLDSWQMRLIVFPGIPLACVAGVCIASIAFTSVQALTGVALTVSCLGTVSLVPILALVAGFVCCLVAATFFLTIKEVISRIIKEKLIEYWNSLKQKKGETPCQHGWRLAWEIVKWGLALLSMATVAWAGYLLFKGKCIDMLGKVWTGLTMKNVASAISFCYSAIKMLFGIEKMMHLLGAVPGAIKKAFSSTESQDKVPLNPIQQQVQSGESSYTKGMLAVLTARAVAGGGFYHQAAVSHHLPLPGGIAVTSTGFIYAINAKPFLHSQEKQTPVPLSLTLKGG